MPPAEQSGILDVPRLSHHSSTVWERHMDCAERTYLCVWEAGGLLLGFIYFSLVCSHDKLGCTLFMNCIASVLSWASSGQLTDVVLWKLMVVEGDGCGKHSRWIKIIGSDVN